MITRRLLLASILAAPPTLAVLPARAAELSLAEISAYLNGLQTVKARFTQVNDDGSTATGTIYINRPGRARFEYDPPEKTLVVVGGTAVAIFDDKSNEPPEQYPLKRTPLSLILDAKVDLSKRKMVVGTKSDGVTTSIIAQDPENPDYGTIEMVFSATPVELRQWIINDANGSQTTVVLGDLEKGAKMPARLFSIIEEKNKRGF